ncbi:unnamed protein product [Symbiodinium sp. CCMP2592]|nr:unnamed protein product [Symbiodinium sp. CCMP2592]
MQHACLALQPEGRASETVMGVAERAALAVVEAESRAVAFGGSTIAVLCQHQAQIGVANLGDSGFVLLRRGMNGMNIIKRSREQQHSFNCPHQLTHLPEALLRRIPKEKLAEADTAKDCERYCADIAEGDLVLMFSDGFSDNIHDHELLHIVDKTLPPAHAYIPPASIAKALALAAQERSVDATATVPFNTAARSHGYESLGGKEDDITVVAAWVVSAKSGLSPNTADKLLKDLHTTEIPREECPSQQRHTPELARTLFESKRRTRDGVLASDTKNERCGSRGPLVFPRSSSKAV